ncbi:MULTISPECIES: flagellar basal body-associated protein FliL [unclassified Herbaspirillum]|uniref:flagellar basal body-associated protein FliL n=1 Tax=unclassified Herbaspirillum TaxID=2624150 RepID=UPI001154A1AA|nr:MULTISPECIES: flagellar basal body-associated protein FliL [unclassified Herbaspirillum]MBB5392924.1 flagellar FliL protein [Herbaspirillum sp. SJZ102]TQK04430.1 flagellar FliL protein [Herbaspirillum sp. SJZ130]TQK09785.1 flagellar FliL protein [Herbaspirillum sp. SJZ106]TWC65865.1 flagellar FliL protein [Herbaspirillum sp. SJZ099]
MATKGKAPAKGAEADTAPAKSSKKMLFIIVGVVLVLAIGGAAFFMMGGKNKKDDERADEKVEAKAPTFVVIEPFVVNLQQETGDHYLQVAMTLQVPNGATAEALKLYMPQVRSRLLMVLSSKKASELLTSEGKRKLTDEIIDQLGEPFSGSGKGPVITDVFYTSFVIQQQ